MIIGMEKKALYEVSRGQGYLFWGSGQKVWVLPDARSEHQPSLSPAGGTERGSDGRVGKSPRP